MASVGGGSDAATAAVVTAAGGAASSTNASTDTNAIAVGDIPLDVKMHRLLKVLTGMVKNLETAVDGAQGRAVEAESKAAAQEAILKQLGIPYLDGTEDDDAVDDKAREVARRVEQLTGCAVGVDGSARGGTAVPGVTPSSLSLLATRLPGIVAAYDTRLARTVEVAWASARVALKGYPPAVVKDALDELHGDCVRITSTRVIPPEGRALKRVADMLHDGSDPAKRRKVA